jgi:hypothetical protein
MASMVAVTTFRSGTGYRIAGHGKPREYAHGREDRHDVSLAQPREQARSIPC